MVGIILQHCVAHNTVDYWNVYQGNFICGLIVDWSMLGRLGVAIFVIIMGYFSVKQTFKINRCIILSCEVWTYSIVTYVVMLSLRLISFSVSGFLNSFFPILFQKYWFISAYLIFYLFTPILNNSLNRLSKKKFKYFLVLQLILWSIIRTLSLNNIRCYGNELEEFLLLYSIGAYLRIWTKYESLNSKKKMICLLFGGITIYFISPILLNYFARYCPFLSGTGDAFFTRTSISTIMIAYSLVGLMESRSYKSNKIINYIAGTTFGIYLFHFSIIDVLLKLFFPINNYLSNPFYLVLYLSVVTVSIFLLSFVVEILRKQVEKIYRPFVYKLSDSIQTKLIDYLL